MTFDATFTDALGKLNNHRQIKATVRGESESTGAADSAARSPSKHFATARHGLMKSNIVSSTKDTVQK